MGWVGRLGNASWCSFENTRSPVPEFGEKQLVVADELAGWLAGWLLACGRPIQ